MSEPIIMEVLAGARDDLRERDLRRLMDRFTLVRFDAPVDFDAATRIYRACRRSGVTPKGMVDCMVDCMVDRMIAAVALRSGARLLSADSDLDHVVRVMKIELDVA